MPYIGAGVQRFNTADNLTVSGTAEITGASTLTGAVTADAGVSIDNITIDGTEIDLSSGNLTLDVAGDINLDADGGDVNFKDGGTSIGYLSNSSGTLLLGVNTSDADFKVQGNDGGSTINALTLDMSDAGAAAFNAGATFDGNVGIGDTTVNSSLQVSKTQTALSGTSNQYGVHIYPTSSGATFVDGITSGSGGAGLTVRSYLNGTYNNIISGSTDTGTTTFQTGGNERMRIDSNGQVQIGTTQASLFNSEGTNAGLTVAGSDTSTTTIGNGGAAINIVQTNGTAGNTSGLHFSRQDTDGTPNYSGAAIVAQFPDTQATGQYPKGLLAFNTSTSANAAPSEKMRLESSGTLFVNETSTNLPCKVHINFNGSAEQGLVLENSVNNSSGAAIRFVDHTDAHTGGGVYFSDSNNINYATSSDARLKDNITDMTGSIDRVKALAPKRFNFISNPDITMDGFLAHEAQAVVPEAVNGTHNQVQVWVEPQVDDRNNIISGEALPDGVSAGDNKLDADGNTIPVYQGIDHSKLVPLLTGALQEAIAKIETLETEMTALKARVTALEDA